MIKKLINQEQAVNCSVVVGIMILIILIMYAGCSSTTIDKYNQSLGSSKKSQEVTKLFKSYKYQPDYKYYYANFMNDPDGVVGIHRDYLIEKSCGRGASAVHWHEFETSPKNLEILIKGIEKKGKPYGADVYDHAGKQVGILYTFEQFEYQTLVRMSENNSICVLPQHAIGIDRRKR